MVPQQRGPLRNAPAVDEKPGGQRRLGKPGKMVGEVNSQMTEQSQMEEVGVGFYHKIQESCVLGLEAASCS